MSALTDLPPPLARGVHAAPFVLLDVPGGARLYRAPLETIIARDVAEVMPALARIEAAAVAGYHLAGTIAYEAGLALEPRLAARAARRGGADGALLWFGAFADWVDLTDEALAAWLAASAKPGPHGIGPLDPAVSPGAYARAFAGLHAAICAGDIYQANLTLPLAGSWRGDPLAIYAALRGAGGGCHGGLIFDGAHWLLSLSPELFFGVAGGAVTAQPMKGTAPRGATPVQDAALAAGLATSAKDRAENLMIVDLLRNDLARVATPGSVRVEDAFAIVTTASVHQMVSTIRADLALGKGAVDVLRALFPCGSVTGAPKIRAMELTDSAERDPRGAYCGAIGRIDGARTGAGAGGKESSGAEFNVAIRTLRLTPGEGDGGRAVLGVGSAVTADSSALGEWRECLIKGSFVNRPMAGSERANGATNGATAADFDLIETMRFAPDAGVPLLELHLERLRDSAAALGFACDRHALRNAIHALCFAEEAPGKLRLLLARGGAYSLEIAPLPPAPPAPMVVAVLPLPVDAGDWRLRHKTSDRWFYDAGLRAAHGVGGDEALLLRDDGLLTEGCFTSLFVPRDGHLLTPPVALGLLPGVLRASLLADARAVEAELTLSDLSEGFFIGNAVRGLLPARLLA